MESTVKGMLDVAEQFRDHTFDFQMSNAELIEVVAKDVAEFKKRLADSYRFLFKKQYKQLKKSRAQELKAKRKAMADEDFIWRGAAYDEKWGLKRVAKFNRQDLRTAERATE